MKEIDFSALATKLRFWSIFPDRLSYKLFEHYFYPLSQKENSGWLERIRKYGDLGENFPSNSNGSFFLV